MSSISRLRFELVIRSACAISAYLAMGVLALATPPPPDIPTYCGGVLCLDVGPVRRDGTVVWPIVTMKQAIHDGQRFQYEIDYGARMKATLIVEVDSTVCGQALEPPDDRVIHKIGKRKATARACARSSTNPNEWLLLKLEFAAQSAAALRELVMSATSAIWIVAIDPEKVVTPDCALRVGQRVVLMTEEFRYE